MNVVKSVEEEKMCGVIHERTACVLYEAHI